MRACIGKIYPGRIVGNAGREEEERRKNIEHRKLKK